MLETDIKDIKQLVENLNNSAVNAYPKTVRATLDREAFIAHGKYKDNVHKNFVIRNENYLKSLRYQKCGRSLNIERMEAKTGQAAKTFGKTTDGFAKQELGSPIVAKHAHIAKPLKAVRGGNYKKLVGKKHYLQNINDVKTIKDLVKHPAKTSDGQFKQAVGVAHHSKKNINFLPEKTSRGQSIIQIQPKKSKKVKKTAKYLYSLKGKVQKLKKVPALEPAGKAAAAKGGEIFAHEAERRLLKEMSKDLKKG